MCYAKCLDRIEIRASSEETVIRRLRHPRLNRRIIAPLAIRLLLTVLLR